MIKKILHILTCLYFFSLISCNGSKKLKTQNYQEVNELEKLKAFAENYEPDTISKTPSKLPELDSNLKHIVLNADKIDKLKTEQYLTLIVLKLYRSHLECCNQAYEIRKKFEIKKEEQPVLYQFIMITGMYNINKNIEFMPSSIAYDWVNKNSKLLSYPPIRIEIKKIKKKEKKIKQGKF